MPSPVTSTARSGRWLLLSVIGGIASIGVLHASTADICDAAAQEAATATGIPPAILQAITRTETGRTTGTVFAPWPWTVNMEGAGHWFPTADDALNFAEAHRAAGALSFDIGCFQINYRWHGDGFTSIAAMFDPVENALYAARFLARLHEEFDTWEAAVGAYHSRTPAHSARYLHSYQQHLTTLTAEPVIVAHQSQDAMAARTPLLIGASGHRGSLVPVAVVGISSLFGGRP